MPLAKHRTPTPQAHPPPARTPVAEATGATAGPGQWRVERHPSGAVLYQPTDEVHGLYLVKQGRVRLLRQTHSGARALVSLVGPGETFGEATVGAGAIGEMAIANTDVEVWSLEATHLAAFCALDATGPLDLIAGMNARMRQMRRRLVGFTAKEVPARLSDTLLALGERHGEPCTHGGEVDLRQITQQDLADLVGASRSFVSTLINEMKRDGSLGSVGRVLCLRDLKALRKAALREA